MYSNSVSYTHLDVYKRQGKEDDFKGSIDLFEMKAYIYNDEKGDDITVTDDLGDMSLHLEKVDNSFEIVLFTDW